jgi:uncharacterized membrane protein YagU involved in acid resistance
MGVLEVILFSGGAAGVLDIAATGILRRVQGMRFQALLQFIASGALGNRAFTGGLSTAGLGLVFHFAFAAFWAGVYFWLSHFFREVFERPWLFGALYGVAVHMVMSQVVMPLSRTAKRPFAWTAWLTQLAIHILCVGIPIAIMQNRYAQ